MKEDVTFPKRKEGKKVKDSGDPEERKAFFFKSYSAKMNRNSHFTSEIKAGFHLWSLFVGTCVVVLLGTRGRAEKSGKILILIELPEKLSVEGDFPLR